MILFTGPIYDISGYAVASRSILKLLFKLGIDIKVFPNNSWSAAGAKLSRDEFNLINNLKLPPGKMIETDTLLVYNIQKTVQVNVPIKFNKGFQVVHTMFETDGVPKDWIDNLNCANWVVLPSKWGVDVFRNNGINNVSYMPICIDTDVFSPDVPKLITDIPQYKFMFIGDTFPRKNLQSVITAFFNSFHGNKDVVLILKMNLFPRERLYTFLQDIRVFRKRFEYPKIYLYNEIIPEQSIPGFINSCDCLVAPSCGEGFGLPQLCAMACGKSIITTDWSACSDYITKDNALLLRYEVQPVSYDIVKLDKNFFGHNWAVPSTEHLGLIMQWVVGNQEESKEIGKKARKTVIEKYSYPVVSELMNKFLIERSLV